MRINDTFFSFCIHVFNLRYSPLTVYPEKGNYFEMELPVLDRKVTKDGALWKNSGWDFQ